MVKSRWLNLSLFSFLGVVLIGIVQTVFLMFLSPGTPQGMQNMLSNGFSIMNGTNSGMNMGQGQTNSGMNMGQGQMNSGMNMGQGQMNSGMNMDQGQMNSGMNMGQGQMNSGMNMGAQTPINNISMVFNLVLLVFIIGLLIGGIGFIASLFRKKIPNQEQLTITK